MFSGTDFKSLVFTDGNALSLTCAVTFGSYSTITLSKVKGNDIEVMATFRSDGSTDVDTTRESRTSRQPLPLEGVTLMMLNLTKAGCEDRGIYRCSHDNGQMSEGNVDIISKNSFTHSHVIQIIQLTIYS